MSVLLLTAGRLAPGGIDVFWGVVLIVTLIALWVDMILNWWRNRG